MEQIPVRHLVEAKKLFYDDPFPLIFFKESDTVDVCLKKLFGFKVLSAPVELANKKFAFIDIADIAIALTDATETAQKELFAKPIGQFCNYSKQNELYSIDVDAPLTDLVKIYVTYGVRRVMITEDSKMTGILSQMDVIRWLSKKGGLSNATKNSPAGTVMSGEPYSVKLSDKVFDSLKGCIGQGFMGCAVLDGEGRVVANLSVSDLRGTSHLSFHQSMKETVEKFLTDMKKFVKTPICCKEKDSFESVVHLMFQNHIHRVYVVDSNNKPIGVISTKDVMKQLLKDL